MDSKLTLKLDKDVIERAKRFADNQLELTGVVAELAGILSGAQVGDPEDEYTDYLVRKYS